MQTLHKSRSSRRRTLPAFSHSKVTTHLTFSLDLPSDHPVVVEVDKLVSNWPKATGGIACSNYTPNHYSFRADTDTLIKLQFKLIRAVRSHLVLYALTW
jgi:hypothetical protein